MMNSIFFLLSICVVVGVLGYLVWLALSWLYTVVYGAVIILTYLYRNRKGGRNGTD